MRSAVLVCLAVFIAPLALADHQTDSLATFVWQETVYAPNWVSPAYPHQCFDVIVDAGPGAVLVDQIIAYGDGDSPPGSSLDLVLDENGRAEKTVCHAYSPSVLRYTSIIHVKTADGREDHDCVWVHWFLGGEHDESCED